MNVPTARPLIACAREVGSECPYCAGEVALGDPIMVCAACGTVHHRNCWRRFERCGAYSCAPSRREVAVAAEPVLAISMEDLDRAVPLPATPWLPVAPVASSTFVPRTADSSGRGRASPLSLAALATALAGVPLLGLALWVGLAGVPLVGAFAGLVAVVLGCVALGGIRDTRRKGLVPAVAGVLLGLADTVGGLLATGWMLEATAGANPHFLDAPPDPAALKALAPELRRAMQANVLLERREALGLAIGSGVILAIDRNEALIVTNRHVVDPHFTSSKALTDPSKLGLLDVKTIGQQSRSGRVVWLAPDGVDLALIRSPCSADGSAAAAAWQKGRSSHVGETVFAIGNPQRLGWTHTQGVISQYRLQDVGGRQLKLIQTQAAINPGNSGGGLYDKDGYLLGINTWTTDKRIGEGISFAIALDSLLDLSPPDVAPPPAEREPLETPAQP
ncbi:MAG: trypsin-like peptidase domain-containing protein [Isosphaeraceae bacterium]|nr:trypsin-like peptidase domain-containing protein [Isosphaeraceae bacterium]